MSFNRLKILAVLFLLLTFSCKNPFAPEPKANLIIDGALQRTYTSYSRPQFEGYVKNIGDNTAYNCMVTITCYSDSSKTTIIDTAHGFPSDLGDIAPGQRAYFDAVAFDCTSHDQIKAYDTKIEWLDR